LLRLEDFLLIDAHAHLDEYPDSALKSLHYGLEAHDILTLSVSMGADSFLAAESIAADSDRIVPALGIHPWDAHNDHGPLDELDAMFERSPFIGEIGLDHRWVTDEAHYPAQRDVFDHQLALAAAQNKLVNVHCSGAERETVEMMHSHGIERAIVHWYAGPRNVQFDMIDLGYSFTVGVEVLRSEMIQDIARAIPMGQLLTETDNPGAQEWLTGEVGMPPILNEVIGTIAEIKGVTLGRLIDSIHANFERLVGDDPHFAPWHDKLAT